MLERMKPIIIWVMIGTLILTPLRPFGPTIPPTTTTTTSSTHFTPTSFDPIPHSFYPSLMLVSGQSVSPPAAPVNITLGVLMPYLNSLVFTSTAGLSDSYQESMNNGIGIMMAVRHINQNTTKSILPITNQLHPYLNIQLKWNDTTDQDSGALINGLYQAEEADILGGIVGTWSSLCISASYAASVFQLPLISMSCTTPLLGDKTVHPTFLRVVPDDEAQGLLLASLIELYGWKRICIIQTNEIYGRSIAQVLINTITSSTTRKIEITVDGSISVEDPSTMHAQINQTLYTIQASGTRIIVLCMAHHIVDVFQIASSLNMLSNSYVWIGSDAVVTDLESGAAAPYASLVNGFIGVVPLVQSTSPPFLRFLDTWSQQNVSDYSDQFPGIPSDLFSQPPSTFDPVLSYDIVLAYSLAVKILVDSGTAITRQSILSTLRAPSFQFDSVSRQGFQFDANGNALPAYLILNLQPVNNSNTNVTNSFQVLSAVTMNGTSATQLIGTPVGDQTLAAVLFHDGTNVPPLDRDINLLLPVDFLVTYKLNSRQMPVFTTNSSTCGFLFMNLTANGTSSIPPAANCTGGFSRLAAYFRSVRAQTSNVIAIDAGASWYFSPYYAADSGVSIARFFSAMQYDAMTLSSSDFSLGSLILVQYLHLLQPACTVSDDGTLPGAGGACMIATTLLVTSGSVLDNSVLWNYVIKTISGHKIALLTIQRDDFAIATNSNGDFVLVDDQAAALQDTITDLKVNKDCFAVVLIATSLVSPARPFLTNLITGLSGVAVALLTYTHEEYPFDVYTLIGADLLEVQVLRIDPAAGDLVHAQLIFDHSGIPVVDQTTLTNVWLPNGSPEIPSMVTDLSVLYSKTQTLLSQPVSSTSQDIYLTSDKAQSNYGSLVIPTANSTLSYHWVDIDGCRVSQCPIGTLLADVILKFCSTCSIAHINSGTIRSGLTTGPITRGDLSNVLPFTNKLTTYEMKGSDFMSLLRFSVFKGGSGGFQQFAGVRFSYTIDRSVPSTSLLNQVLITDAEVADASGVYHPIQSSSTYKIISVFFVVQGGDGFTMINSAGQDINTYDVELIEWWSRWLSQGSLSSYHIETHNELIPCWNQSYVLHPDPRVSGSVVWPVAECRIISAVQESNAQLCPSLETTQTITTTSVIANGSTVTNSTTKCVCIQSYTRDDPSVGYGCSHCANNRVKTLIGDHACVCDATHYLIPNFLQGQPFQCIDPTGYNHYSVAPDTTDTCKLCPPCLGCLLWNELNVNMTDYASSAATFDQWAAPWWILQGWWWDGKSNIIYRCPTTGSQTNAISPGCKGTWLNLLPCETGYEGPLCMECSSGYGGSSHGVCSPCANPAASVTLLLFSIIGVIVVLVFVVYSSFLPRSHTSSLVKILVRHLQTAAFIGAFRISDGDILRGFGAVMGITNTSGAKALAYRCVFPINAIDHMWISSVVLLILILAIIAALVSREIRKRWYPTEEDDKMFKIVDARTFLCSCCSRNEVDDDDRPPGAQPSASPLKHIKTWSWEQVCLPVCVVILLFLYPSLVLESVSFLQPCIDLNGIKYMADDTSITCTSDQYHSTFNIAVFRLVFVGLGTPIMMFIRLYSYRRALLKKSDSRSKESRSFFLRYRFLIEGYTDSAWYWDIVGMIRHGSMVLCVVFLTADDVTQASVAALVLLITLLLTIYRRPFRHRPPPSEREAERHKRNSSASSAPQSSPEESLSSNGRGILLKPTKTPAPAQPGAPVDPWSHRPLLNLNLLESISLLILIASICLSSISHSDVVSGHTETESSSEVVAHANMTAGTAYQDQSFDTSDPSIQPHTFQSSFSLFFQWMVVILHSAFVIFIIYYGWPQVRTIEWWKERGSVILDTMKRGSLLPFSSSSASSSQPSQLASPPSYRSSITAPKMNDDEEQYSNGNSLASPSNVQMSAAPMFHTRSSISSHLQPTQPPRSPHQPSPSGSSSSHFKIVDDEETTSSSSHTDDQSTTTDPHQLHLTISPPPIQHPRPLMQASRPAPIPPYPFTAALDSQPMPVNNVPPPLPKTPLYTALPSSSLAQPPPLPTYHPDLLIDLPQINQPNESISSK